MPLTAKSPVYLHFLQNFSLIALSLFFMPLCTLIALVSQIVSPFAHSTNLIRDRRRLRAASIPNFRPQTVLVTGVGMCKGLTIARSFYQAGQTVIGADFEQHGIPPCGRFSTALKRFYRLPSNPGSSAYIEALIDIVNEEKVDLWVSCSGVASAIQDGEAAEIVEKRTSCKAIQFGASLTETLHEKHSFIENGRRLGLNVPETHLVTSVDDAMQVLHPAHSSVVKKKYIMKSVGLDDSIRADMTLLPRLSLDKTMAIIAALHPGPSRPFVLQEFIRGPEYCTHSVVIRGRVVAFTCCPSSELLMHYKALPPASETSKALLKYTELYAEKMGEEMTGHFTVDFLLSDDSREPDLMKRLYPIECNPRAHTAVVTLADDGEDMAEAYLSIFTESDPKLQYRTPIVTPSSNFGYYWIGHDIVTRIFLPLLAFVTMKISFYTLVASWREFFEHLTTWRDGTFQVWDPWPAWWLYCGYWPCMFLMSIFTGSWWSRCNVSTTKMFRC